MMKSIIGYTRVPSSIAPVKRLSSEGNNLHFHRMFLRQTTQSNGIIELIAEPQPLVTTRQSPLGYSTFLAIDISNHLKDKDMQDTVTLMTWISNLAYENATKFNQILDLLRKLQNYGQYQFPSRIDKQQELILIYFPNAISHTSDQTYVWLKTHLEINLERYTNWHIHMNPQDKQDDFDGHSYFKDIHKFIDQVDALIESNGLFSHLKKDQ